MSSFDEFTEKNAPEWPYPVNYDKENELSFDVVVLGGGVAGCHAAINAAKRGMKVAVVEKGATVRSGGGAVDHWGAALTNPCSTITPDELVSKTRDDPYVNGIFKYITMKESWDALLDVEQMGVQFRDVNDEFAGAPFRDDETKIMFAYDYTGRTNIRVRGGAKIKPALYKELRKLGVKIYDRVMATSLLTEGGKQGARVVGATGVNVRTGEFYIFKAKSTVLATSHISRLWVFSTELAGSNVDKDDPNDIGDGQAMAWRAGAELTHMEKSRQLLTGSFGWPEFGIGSPTNTWYPCSIVDANGKEVPWEDREGNLLETIEDRTRSHPEKTLISDLVERIQSGEFVMPLFADLPGMPEYERRAIWGLMVGNEGKTRVPVYEVYGQAGFDPNKDMLRAPIIPLEAGGEGAGPSHWRTSSSAGGGQSGGMVVDWDLKTSLDGLYVAGNQIGFGGGGHPGAAATGRYAGRKAAAHAKTVKEPTLHRKQIDDEKARVYAPVGREGDIGWKELYAGIAKVMQIFCPAYKNENMLEIGLWYLNSIRESEAARTYVRNPHELGRFIECLTRINIGEMTIHASMARKASSRPMGLNRLDYPEIDPREWRKYLTIKLENGKVKVGELPLLYWTLPPNAPTYKENYDLHCGLDQKGDK